MKRLLIFLCVLCVLSRMKWLTKNYFGSHLPVKDGIPILLLLGLLLSGEVIMGGCQTEELKTQSIEELTTNIQQLVSQLGAENWKMREKAQSKLIETGKKLFWEYRKNMKDEKEKVKERIKQFANALNEAAKNPESGIRIRVKYIKQQLYPLTRPKIAFRSMRNNSDKRKIYLMDEDGQNQTKLTRTNQFESNAFWSPDGTKIAFVTEYYTIFVDKWILNIIGADGGNHIRLTNTDIGGEGIGWSPDSTKIAFASAPPEGLYDIYILDAKDGTQVNLTCTPAAADDCPNWSPDGTKVAFESRVNWCASDIYAIDADGKNLNRLTKTDESWERHPVWSPDGTKIAYISHDSNKEKMIYLYVMDADGQNQTKLAQITQKGLCYDTYPYPVWSPDGTKIVIYSESEQNRKVTICVIKADGKNQVTLTPNEKYDILPEWSPDGTKIVFESHRDGRPKIYVYDMEADGNNQKRLSKSDDHDEYPAWQPLSLSEFSALFAPLETPNEERE